MIVNKISIRMDEMCYYIFFVLILFAKGIGWYDGQTQFKITLVLAVIFLIGKMLLTKYSLRDISIICFIIFVGGFSYYVSGEKGLLLYCLMAVGVKDILMKRVFKVGLITWLLSFGGLIIYYLFHLSDSVYKVHEKLGLGHMFRYALGYAHPNILHLSYLVFLFFIIYLLDKKYTIRWFIVLMLGNLYIFLYSVSYTGVIIATFYLCISLYWRYRQKINMFESIVIQCILLFSLVISLIVPIIITGPSFLLLDKIFNSRLWLAKYFLRYENINLWGMPISKIITPSLTMDNAYVYSLITYGVITFALLMMSYFLLINLCLKEKKTKELAIILATVIMGITEAFMFNTSFKNISFLFLGELIFISNSGKCNIVMLSNRNKTWEFDISLYNTILTSLKHNIKVNKNRIIAAILVSGLIVSGIIGVMLEEPYSVIVPRVNCEDVGKETAIFLNQNYQEKYPNSIIIDYKDNHTKMQEFSGNITKIESIRKCITTFIMTSALIYLIYIFMNIVKFVGRKK